MLTRIAKVLLLLTVLVAATQSALARPSLVSPEARSAPALAAVWQEPQDDGLQEKPQDSMSPAVETPKELSTLRKLEKKIDAGAGVLVKGLKAVLFLPIGESKVIAEAAADLKIDGNQVQVFRDLLAEIKKRDEVELEKSQITLTLPIGFLTEDKAKVAAKALTKELQALDDIKVAKISIAYSKDAKMASMEAIQGGMPAIVLWLVIGAVVFTLTMGFINFRAFGHAIQVVRGKYDDPKEAGEVTHFQALSSALSATVGLGNIAGVAIAVSLGGPGATFWMILAGLLGMSSKFVECTLGQMYRKVDADGHVSGGAMHYLADGLKERGLAPLGKVLAVAFAILCVGGSLGGGNTFQVVQSLGAVKQTFGFLEGREWIYGLLMTVAAGVVIIGGIKRIAQTAEKIVPLMCGIYVVAALFVIIVDIKEVPHAFVRIFEGAFSPSAAYGGLIGVLVVGFQRAAFSNEAGVGSAAIAHSAAKTEEPVREGIVALLEPFIDTVVVCTMTALVIVITDADESTDAAMVAARESGNGALLTSLAFESAIAWFPTILSVAVMLFAFSTMISWSYYGERCWTWLFGEKSSIIYKMIFLLFVFLGSIVSATNILDFSDLMILGMAFPNILGIYFLTPKVRKALTEYMRKLKAGEFKTFK